MNAQWTDIRFEKPQRGQRCLVWDVDYMQVELAYWDADKGLFYTPGSRDYVRVEFWMPEPDRPAQYGGKL